MCRNLPDCVPEVSPVPRDRGRHYPSLEPRDHQRPTNCQYGGRQETVLFKLNVNESRACFPNLYVPPRLLNALKFLEIVFFSVLRIHLILMRIRIQVMNIYWFFTRQKFSNYFSPFLCFNLMNHSEIREFLIISLFSTVNMVNNCWYFAPWMRIQEAKMSWTDPDTKHWFLNTHTAIV